MNHIDAKFCQKCGAKFDEGFATDYYETEGEDSTSSDAGDSRFPRAPKIRRDRSLLSEAAKKDLKWLNSVKLQHRVNERSVTIDKMPNHSTLHTWKADLYTKVGVAAARNHFGHWLSSHRFPADSRLLPFRLASHDHTHA